jgi:hypothetical protein
LELYKRGAVDLEQASRLGELHISWLGLDDEDDVDGGGGLGGATADASAGDRSARDAVLAIGGSGLDEYEG